MSRVYALSSFALLACAVSSAWGQPPAQNEDFDASWRPERWSFSNGPEFPGARGSFERSAQAAHAGQYGGRLAFDFQNGGNYVAAILQLQDAPEFSAIRLWLHAPEGHGLTVRYTDQTDQTLQKPFWAPGGRWVDVVVPLDQWTGHWGGANDGQIHGAPKSIALLVERGPEETGELQMDDMQFLAGDAARAAATTVAEYQAFTFGADEHWGLHADGNAGTSALKGTHWKLDFSRGATTIGIAPRDVSLLGDPQEIRIRIRGKAAGHPVRLQIATHFMTFEKTIGELANDGLNEIVVAAPPSEGWRWYGGENDGKRHGPLRIRGLSLDANGQTDQPQLELVDVRVKASCAANRCCVLTAACDNNKDRPAFTATVRSLAPTDIAGTLTHTIRDWSGNVLASGSSALTIPAGGMQRVVVAGPVSDKPLLEAEFVYEAPGQLVPAAQTYFTRPPQATSDNVLRPASPFGMGLYLYRYGSDPASLAEMDRAAELGAAAGVKWSREEVSWGRVEVAPGKYDWAFYDQVVATAKKHGISVYGLLAYWSRWTKPYTAEGIADYCRFARAAAEHYRNDIQYWEVYNEPNIFFWQGPRDMYAELLTKAYAAIREGNPQAQVLGCSTAGIDLPFIRRTVELGAPFDILTIHPYRGDLADRRFIADLAEAAKTAAAPDGKARPVWITEMGWATHVPHNSTTEGFRVTTQRDQACKIARAYIDAIASGVCSNISWYDFRNDGDDPFNFEHNMGVVTQQFQLKPAYRALATITRLLEGCRVDQPLQLGDTVVAYPFVPTAGGPATIVLWDTRARRTVELAVSGSKARLVNLMGETTTIPIAEGKTQVPIERDSPVFLLAEDKVPADVTTAAVDATAEPSSEWISLFDGRTLDGWRAAEHAETWRVDAGQLIAKGPRSHLFYAGPVGGADFRNFELEAEVKTGSHANSGIYFHTEFQDAGWPAKGYEVQINNTYVGEGNDRELKKTGSLYGVRTIYKSGVPDEQWFRLRVRVVANRIRIWVNDLPTVDYLQPDDPPRSEEHAGKRLSHGTVALQGHDAASEVAFRSIKIRPLPSDADPQLSDRAPDSGYGVDAATMDRLAAQSIPLIDFHIHLRGGLTPAKALSRQAVTGIASGALDNIGKGWTIETDEQLRAFLDRVAGMPMFIGMQVNDRDWMHRHSPELLARLDYVLADTMIMPMPTDDSPPAKLWLTDQYPKIENAEAWMERYMRHNLRVLAEPITILANPTYLPPGLEDKYDQLWTDERMRQVIQAALDNHVALEINASSPWPHERFIRMAKSMGAKFTFGTNNFDDKPISMARCIDAIGRFGLTPDDLYVPK
jgi:hypothetical protein